MVLCILIKDTVDGFRIRQVSRVLNSGQCHCINCRHCLFELMHELRVHFLGLVELQNSRTSGLGCSET